MIMGEIRNFGTENKLCFFALSAKTQTVERSLLSKVVPKLHSLEPRDQEIDEFYVVQKRRAMDFDALNL